MLKILMTLFGLEYFFASGITNYVLRKTNLVIPEELKEIITDRVHRLRLDIKLLAEFVWLLVIIVGIPVQFKIWGLQLALFLERLLNPIFQFFAYCEGLITGFMLGILVAIALWVIINWFENQKAKLSIYCLLYRCGAIE